MYVDDNSNQLHLLHNHPICVVDIAREEENASTKARWFPWQDGVLRLHASGAKSEVATGVRLDGTVAERQPT